MSKYLIGYEANWDDNYDTVVNEPIYSETQPPVELREEYLGELVMRLWYLLNVDYRLGLPEVTVTVKSNGYLQFECGDGENVVLSIRVNRELLSYDQLLQFVLQYALQQRSKNLKDTSFTAYHKSQYEVWRREQ